ncbi:MAG: hypothetical protein ABIT37_00465 [Luteolibacter sp.]
MTRLDAGSAAVPSKVARKSSVARNRPQARNGPGTAVLREAVVADPQRCEAIVLEIVGTEDAGRATELETVLRRWMSYEDPEKLVKRLESLTNGTIWQRWTGAFFNAWAATNYAQAMAAADTMRQFGYARAVAAVEHQDGSFLNYLATAEAPLSGNKKLVLALSSLGRDNPELARSIDTWKGNQEKKSELISAVAGGWASRDPARAMTWIQSMKLSAADAAPLLSVVLAEWCKSDLAGARKAMDAAGIKAPMIASSGDESAMALRALEDPSSSDNQLSLALFKNPFIDVAGMHHVLDAAGIDWDKKQFAQPAINHEGWYFPDPANAAKEAEQLPAGNARDFILKNIAEQWAAADPVAAREFADRHGIESIYLREPPSAELRAAALQNPEQTFDELFDPKNKNGDERTNNLTNLNEEWADEDPQAASEWLMNKAGSTGEPITQVAGNTLIGNILGYRWARTDMFGATHWMESLPDGPVKTAAWKGMSHYTTSYSPELAFTISARLLDDESRLPMLQSSIQEINRKIGEPVARALIGSPDLSDEERATLLKSISGEANNPPPSP